MIARTAFAIAFALFALPAASYAQESFAIIAAGEELVLNEQPPVDGIAFDGGVGSGADLSGNGSMVQILQLQPSGSSIAGSAVGSRFATASAARR